MYDQKKLMEEMIKYMKYLFEHSQNTMQMMFDHSDKLMEFFISQGDNSHSETHMRVREWIDNSKKLRDDYIGMMGEHFKKMQRHFESD